MERERKKEREIGNVVVLVGGRYDSIENCAVNKLVGLSCFPRLQPAGASVCLFVSLLHCSASFSFSFSCIRTVQMTTLPATQR